MHLRAMLNVWSQSIVENSTKHGKHRRASSAQTLIAIFFVVGELGVVRGDNILEAGSTSKPMKEALDEISLK